ncbi:cupin-like domain-containing protein [Streptomyces sp. NBC_01565]|uniref:cupin-like domain-containing protein n=1 Tax=unclassified Streptomyces TaxID=2593676 RepID=UPI0022562365|nr:cupin-like domain-containing protein [Streptomyces sp. NBC_01565]MCX4540024.1 cupin-like domain-containing protein [Streptomyces sp. NBC_01565]
MSTPSTPEAPAAQESTGLSTLPALLCGAAPALLRGAGLHWPVFAALSEGSLRARPDRPVEAEYRDRRPVTVSLSDVLDDMRAHRPQGLYLRHQLVSEFDPALLDLVPREVRRLNWLLALESDARPDWTWLMIGAAGTSSPMHVDVMASAAWNLLCTGTKRWIFHPPERAEEWSLLPPGCAAGTTDSVAADGRPLEFLQEAGDIVVTPSGWAHEVHNVTGSIAVTGNFINHSNLDFAHRYFELTGDTDARDVLVAVGEAFARHAEGGSR